MGLYGRQGAELYRLGECELVRSAFRAGERGLDAALALSYFAELLDAFAQEGEAEDTVYRLALAVIGRGGRGDVGGRARSRYLEAWLLKLHGIYPPLDRCAGLRRARCPHGELPLPPARARVRLRHLRAGHRPRAEPRDARVPARDLPRAPPAAVPGAPPRRGLEAFHRELIGTHLERDLRSHRVMRDVAREIRG